LSSIAEALERVRSNIAAAADEAGRDPREVTLVAISKEISSERIREAIEAGQREFGENRVKEAVVKHEELAEESIRWHFVGRLQRNKVKQLLEFVHLIHSVDRIELGLEIDKRSSSLVEVLVEVNTSDEESKGGVEPSDLDALLEAMAEIGRIRVSGLMTMAPLVGSPEQARPYFRKLAEIAAEAQARFPLLGIRHLSMGMSQDYAVAVQEGATIVRVGEAIFGPRSARGPSYPGSSKG
jgi:hypothetical protein